VKTRVIIELSLSEEEANIVLEALKNYHLAVANGRTESVYTIADIQQVAQCLGEVVPPRDE
jgi:hypothetical protein